MPRLIHLNGPPGIGKSTLARRYVAEHPGVLDCDVDVLRTMIGDWEQDFGGAGTLIRPVALAMIGTYLTVGHDVVLPQMLVDPTQVALFEACAVDAGATFVERFVMDGAAASVARFHRRGSGPGHAGPDPWHEQVRAVVATLGGDDELRRRHTGLVALLALRPAAVVVDSVEGRVDETYAALVGSLS